ncbi:MAG TPA: lipid-A-disaccharide synthase [Acidobacteriaceae bacterium]|nr:lipid-A-disaccharide synthase [Acidobacteriaceae bacterium]
MLIEELRARLPDAQFFGLGGQAMEAAGCERVARAEDIAVMGITEVIQHMPRIYGEYRRLVRSIRARQPEVAVLIDFPDVNLRLARELKKMSIPVVYFVSPQLWAWKKRRIRWVQDRVTRMLVIFPFEESYYRERGVDAEFVGHPLAELPQPTVTREEFAARFALDPGKEWIALLPGSRPKEVRLNSPGMVAAAAKLGDRYDYILPAAATLSPTWVREIVAQCGSFSIHVVEDARAALFHARASVVASGTATVEAALIGNPFIVVYRLSNLSYAVARRLINLPHVAMVNLIAGYRIVPELIQDEFTATNVAGALQPLLEEGPVREQMRQNLLNLRGALSVQKDSGVLGTGNFIAANPIARVAECVVHLASAQNTPASSR